MLLKLNYSSAFPPTLSALLCLQQLCYFQAYNVYLTLLPPNITGLSYFVKISCSVSSTLFHIHDWSDDFAALIIHVKVQRYKLITNFPDCNCESANGTIRWARWPRFIVQDSAPRFKFMDMLVWQLNQKLLWRTKRADPAAFILFTTSFSSHRIKQHTDSTLQPVC